MRQVDVVGADGDGAGKLLFDPDTRFVRVGQVTRRAVDVHRARVLLRGARRIQLVEQRAIDDRPVHQKRLRRQPSLRRACIDVVGREGHRKRVRDRTRRHQVREIRVGSLLVIQPVPAAEHGGRPLVERPCRAEPR